MTDGMERHSATLRRRLGRALLTASRATSRLLRPLARPLNGVPTDDEPAIRIFTFHSVNVESWHPIALPPKRFARFLDLIQAETSVLSMAEFEAMLLNNRPAPRRASLLTFDDGYLDNLSVAAPLLAERGLPATVFVTINHLYKDYTVPGGKERLYLDPQTLAELAASPGIEIGGHGYSHLPIGRLPFEKRERELKGAYEHLSGLLGKPLRAFSFPFGGPLDYDLEALHGVARLFNLGFSNRPRPILPNHSPCRFALPRFHLDAQDDESVVRAILRGDHDLLDPIYTALRHPSLILRADPEADFSRE